MALSASFNGIQLASHSGGSSSSNRGAPLCLPKIGRPWLASGSDKRRAEGRRDLLYMGAKGLKTYIKVNRLKGEPQVLRKVRENTSVFKPVQQYRQ